MYLTDAVISGSLPVKLPTKKYFKNFFIAPKDSPYNLRGRLSNYFWAIRFISAVIGILDPLLVQNRQKSTQLLISNQNVISWMGSLWSKTIKFYDLHPDSREKLLDREFRISWRQSMQIYAENLRKIDLMHRSVHLNWRHFVHWN